ncbi:hypothetical protein DEM34_18620 [Spiribacter halobius]|uniref:Uncharacterized protein n=2 Tax=Sediminicurvatus halobius TaxID=2182432 RepID=A0A2U2MVY8_9GAMM|nr:hypothetical protein DEM34_18620 [Spiribacter halobius]
MVQRIDQGELLTAADLFFLSNLTEAERTDLLTLNLNDYSAQRLKDVFGLKYDFVATTNFDKSLLDAYANVVGAAAHDFYLSSPAFKSIPFQRDFFIARLHGALEAPESIVLTSESFRKLENDRDYERALHYIFTRCNAIFLGFSFSDPAINSVLDTINRDLGALHTGRHIALLPADASSDLASTLRARNVQVLEYENDGSHQALWDILKGTAKKISAENRAKPSRPPVPTLPLTKYLASCLARLRMRKDLDSLRATIVEGVVSQEIRSSGDEGTPVAELVHLVHEELGLRQDQVRAIVVGALRSLEDEGLIRRSSRTQGRYVWAGPVEEFTAENDLDIVVRGVEDRYVTREGGTSSDRLREAISLLFNDMLASRGWDLGASFATGEVPEDIDCISIVQTSPHFVGDDLRRHAIGIARCFNDLFSRPNQSESKVLSVLGRTAFALELLFASPRDAVFLEATMPNKIYLDANVLLPAIVPGHPLHEIYNQAIQKLLKLRSASDRRVQICVCRGFLNEIFSHKNIAKREVDASEDEAADFAVREARYMGSQNINVFLAAFANSNEANEGKSLDLFLRRVAPYRTEGELRTYIEQMGISVINGRAVPGVGESLPKILHFLEVAYSKDLEKGLKTSAVVEHDAVQLAALRAEARIGRSVLFVSADKRLRGELAESEFDDIRGQFMSHLGLAQLVDLLVGSESEERELSNIYWTASVSTETERMRAFLVDTALREYEVGMLEPMHRAVDIVTQEAINELEDNRGKGRKDRNESRPLTRLVEDYEEKFYRLMREAYEKRLNE